MGEFIGDSKEEWSKYKQDHGAEAYRYRKLYERAVQEIYNLHDFIREKGLKPPTPDHLDVGFTDSDPSS